MRSNNDGILEVLRSTVVNNRATGSCESVSPTGSSSDAQGGGIYNVGKAHLVAATLSGNVAAGGAGLNGAYLRECCGGPGGDGGTGQGGAIYNEGRLRIDAGVLADNIARGGQGGGGGSTPVSPDGTDDKVPGGTGGKGGDGEGGGIENLGTLELTNGTLTGNVAAGGAGGAGGEQSFW